MEVFQMSEEEKKAIEYIKEFKSEVFEGVGSKSKMAKNIDIVLNLIEKQCKVIDEMAKSMDADYLNPRTAEEIKQYFYRKVEEDEK